MRRPHTLVCYLLFSTFFWAASALGQASAVVVDGKNFNGQNTFEGYVDWAVDSLGNLLPEEVQHLPFKPFTGAFFLSKGTNYWFRFSIRNSSVDSFNAVLSADEFMTTDLFYKNQKVGWEHRKAGRWTNQSERSYPHNRFCHFVSLPGGTDRTYFIKLSDLVRTGHSTPNFKLLTRAQEKESRLEYEIQTRGNRLFQGIFICSLVLITIFSLLHFFAHSERPYVYYAGYTASLFLFYLRSLDLDQPLPVLGELIAYHLNLEAPLGYLCYIFYLAFVRSFLHLPRQLPILDRFMRWGIIAFVVLFVADVLVFQLFRGIEFSLKVHAYAKLPFFLLAFWVAIPSFFQLRSRLASYVQVGTTLLLLPAIFTVYTEVMPGVYQPFTTCITRSFTPAGSDITLHMYDMRVGLMLEMICFLFGLYYKTRLDELRFKALSDEMEHLKVSQKEQKKVVETFDHPFIREIRSIVEANLANENFGTPELASAMRLGRVQLYRKMMELIHISPSEFIRELRMEAAKGKLQNSAKTVSEVAYEVGFKDAAHFARAYRKKFGVTPKNDQNGV